MRSALCVLVLVGCGGNSVALSDYAKSYTSAYCAFEVACQQMPDQATCEASVEFDFATIVAQVNAKTIKYDADQARTCIDSVAAASCLFSGWFLPADPCLKVFTGTVATGGACFVSEECAGNTTQTAECIQTDPNCDTSTTCCPGTCQPLPAKKPVGGACASTPDCQPNLYCNSASGQCAQPATTAGAPCMDYDGCADPLHCNTQGGTCVTAAASGAACNPQDDIPCADSRDYCDLATMKCTLDVAVGASCPAGATCVGYAYCDNNNTCVEYPKLGEACMPPPSIPCLPNLECTNNTCTLPPAGMACK